MTEILPVAVVGAGPVGLITALGLAHHGVPVSVFEEDDRLSLDTKAGTVL
ncbi:FAD-dependent monooxygenase, partial [Nonomuraea sp. NPDC004297]